MSDRTDFGGTLRSTREGHGWSLEDVSHRTRIPLSTLRQLEDNDYARFPSLSYAKSFLAQYSEHLGVDAAEYLDHFETGDALANLDSYEYLKDHDERVGAAPLVMKRAKPRKAKDPKRGDTSSRRALQPLMVFSVTALLITAAVFGFMKVSAKLSEPTGAASAEAPAEETLAPLARIPGSRTSADDAVLPDVPRAIPVTPEEDQLVAGHPSRTSGSEPRNSTPSTQRDAPTPISLDNPPPRAVIVEE